MSDRLSALNLASLAKPLGRREVLISDEVTRSVIVLEFVFRSEDITVWHGSRTLAVMHRHAFVAWLWQGGLLVVDDLAWSVEGYATYLTIDGHHSYSVDAETLAALAEFA